MKNTNKNLIKKIILKTFGILAVLAFGVAIALPTNARAEYNGYSLESDSLMYKYNSSSDSDKKINSAPVIYSISQEEALAGSQELLVTIAGADFVPESVARLDGSSRKTTFVNSKKLTMKITSADLEKAENYLISVYNPAPGGGISNSVPFIVNSAGNNLAANALFAGDFMPTSFFGWLLLLVLIIVLVVLARKAYGGDKHKHTPLKHA